MRRIILAAALPLVTLGCAGTDTNGVDQVDQQTPRAEPTADSSTSDPQQDQEPPKYGHDYEESITWEDGGFSISIRSISIWSREAMIQHSDRLVGVLSDDTSTVVVIQASTRNDSGEVANWYPGQAELVLGDEQVQPPLSFAGVINEGLGDNDWQPGTERQGQLGWPLRSTYDTVVSQGHARMLIEKARSEDFSTYISQEAEITLEWPTPSSTPRSEGVTE